MYLNRFVSCCDHNANLFVIDIVHAIAKALLQCFTLKQFINIFDLAHCWNALISVLCHV